MRGERSVCKWTTGGDPPLSWGGFARSYKRIHSSKLSRKRPPPGKCLALRFRAGRRSRVSDRRRAWPAERAATAWPARRICRRASSRSKPACDNDGRARWRAWCRRTRPIPRRRSGSNRRRHRAHSIRCAARVQRAAFLSSSGISLIVPADRENPQPSRLLGTSRRNQCRAPALRRVRRGRRRFDRQK